MLRLRPKRTEALLRLRAVSHKVTWSLGTRFPDVFPLVFLVGYPKSGTTWMSQLVADYLQLPFPRFSYLPVGCPAVVHGHQGVWDSYPRTVYSLRDARDTMCSLYFMYARDIPEGDHPRMTRRQKRMCPSLVNKANVRENLPEFIEIQMKRPEITPYNWAKHVETYLNSKNQKLALLQYERLLSNGREELAQAMEKITGEPSDMQRIDATLDKYSFARQAGRRPGQEDRSHSLRKGQPGDWINHFTREAADILDHFCGETMIRLGYCTNHDWVKQCS